MVRMFLLVLATSVLVVADSPEAEIRAVMDRQAVDWNRGDLPSFVDGYLDSPELVFVGQEFTRGREHLLERYQNKYGTRDKMGTLEFTDIEIQLLGTDYANVRGRFHLARSKEGGGDAHGVFTLLFKQTPRGWKIIQDHTS